MSNRLYSRILNSIDKEIKTVIDEQFNIGNMNLNDKSKSNYNIFNKFVVDPQNVYDRIMHHESVFDYEIIQLNDIISAVKIKNDAKLRVIVHFYSNNYPNDSMNWLDVSNVINMTQMFMGNIYGKNKYNGDISQWDVSNVEEMPYMFQESLFNQDISNWNVSSVNNMTAMFYYAAFNQDISQWDVSNVMYMTYMFMLSDFKQDISGWDVSNVIRYKEIFNGCQIKNEYKPAKFRL